jgi:hypothetical protein
MEAKRNSGPQRQANAAPAAYGASLSDSQGIGIIGNDDANFAPLASQIAAFAPGAGGGNSGVNHSTFAPGRLARTIGRFQPKELLIVNAVL